MIILILILAIVLRLINLNQSLWLDEAAQVIESIRPLNQQFNIPADFHPPLFHLLLHFWMQINTSEIWLRLLPVILSLLSTVLIYKISLLFVTKRIALLVTFLLSISPFHIYYAQEIRPYMLSVVLGLLSTYFFLENNFKSYVITSILFVYSLYLALFLLISHGVYIILFEQKRLKQWILAKALIIISLIPWLPKFFEQLQIGTGLITTLPGWSDAVSVIWYKTLPLTFIKFFIGRITFDNKIVYATVAVLLFLITAISLWQLFKKQITVFKKLFILSILPIFLVFLTTLLIPVMSPQRVLYTLPLFLLLLTCGLTQFSKRLQYVFLTIIILVNVYGLWQYYTNPRFQREQWRQVVDYIEFKRNFIGKQLVIFVFPEAFAPWQWYSHKWVEYVAVAPEFVVNNNQLTGFFQNIISSNTIYYFHYLEDLTDPNRLTQKYLQDLGFVEKEIEDFPGVGFISIYEKNFAYN